MKLVRKTEVKDRVRKLIISICDEDREQPARTIVINFPDDFNFTVEETEELLGKHICNMIVDMQPDAKFTPECNQMKH